MLLHVTNEPIDRSHLEPENAVCHEDLLGKAIIEDCATMIFKFFLVGWMDYRTRIRRRGLKTRSYLVAFYVL